MGLLDMRTVFTSYLLVNVLGAAVIASLWLRNRSRFTGIGLWLTDFVFQSVGLLLIVLRGAIPDFLSIIVANVLVYSGTILLYMGLQKYVGKPTRQWHNAVMLAVYAAVQIYFTFAHPNLAARNINGALALIFIASQIAWLMIRAVGPRLRPETQSVGWVMVGFALAAGLRIGLDLAVGSSTNLFDSPWTDASIILANQMLFIALTFTLVLMVNHRLLKALESDIQERIAAESALKKSEEKFSVAFQTIPDPVLISVLSSGELVEVNESFFRVIGYSKDEVLGKTTLQLGLWVYPEERNQFTEELTSVGRVIDREITFRRENGVTFTAEISSETLELNGTHCVLSIIRDVSAAKRAERQLLESTEELVRSNRDLEQFAYVASHDLQEPLRMVINYTQLLERRYRGQLDADADDFIGFAVDGARRMQTLITELLAYSRVGTTQAPFVQTPLEEVLLGALDNLQSAIEESGAVITHDPMPTAFCDGVQMGQVLQNLIGNALKFRAEEQPRIHVGAVGDGESWTISVADNGIGIEPEYFDQIFQIYQRLLSRSEYPGTGMGLAICKRIIERHGQRIWVESGAGKGTTFFFTVAASE